MHVHSRRRSSRSEGIRAASTRFALILAVHVAFVIALLQVDPELRRQVVPVLVSIVSAPELAPVQEPPPVPAMPRKESPPTKAVSPKPVQLREAAPTTAPSAITAEPSIVSEATVTSPAPVPAAGSPAAPAVEAKAAPSLATPTPPPPAVVPPRFDAAYLNNPRPDYPKAAKRMGEQGRVMLRVLVSVAGAPEKIEIGTSSGSRRLDDAARLAVEQWKFVPARQGDLPVAAWVIVPITFALEG